MCDASCDNTECGYDAGDCDTKHVTDNIKMMEVPISTESDNEYTFTSRDCAVFWNLAQFSANASLVRLSIHSCQGERRLSYTREKAVLVLVVRSGEEGRCRFNISRTEGNREQNFHLSVNWKLNKENTEQFKSNFLGKIQEINEKKFKKRKLLDAFGDSLLFVNNLYNRDYGFVQRKVPAHMPHLLDVNILKEMEGKYQESWKSI